MNAFLQNLRNFLLRGRPSKASEEDAHLSVNPKGLEPFKGPGTTTEIIKPNLPQLSRRFDIVLDEKKIRLYFDELDTFISDTLRQKASPQTGNHTSYTTLERGRLPGDQRYLFLQFRNRDGWLFETTSSGWVIAQVCKIASRDLFVRRGEAIEITSVYSEGSDDKPPRLHSPRLFGPGYVSFSLYKAEILNKIEKYADSLGTIH